MNLLQKKINKELRYKVFKINLKKIIHMIHIRMKNYFNLMKSNKNN